MTTRRIALSWARGSSAAERASAVRRLINRFSHLWLSSSFKKWYCFNNIGYSVSWCEYATFKSEPRACPRFFKRSFHSLQVNLPMLLHNLRWYQFMIWCLSKFWVIEERRNMALGRVDHYTEVKWHVGTLVYITSSTVRCTRIIWKMLLANWTTLNENKILEQHALLFSHIKVNRCFGWWSCI